MTTEQWLPVPGFENAYAISDHGRVRSLDRVIVRCNGAPYSVRGRLLRVGVHRRSGMRCVSMSVGKRKCYRRLYITDRLLAEVFGHMDTSEAA